MRVFSANSCYSNPEKTWVDCIEDGIMWLAIKWIAPIIILSLVFSRLSSPDNSFLEGMIEISWIAFAVAIIDNAEKIRGWIDFTEQGFLALGSGFAIGIWAVHNFWLSLFLLLAAAFVFIWDNKIPRHLIDFDALKTVWTLLLLSSSLSGCLRVGFFHSLLPGLVSLATIVVVAVIFCGYLKD